MTILDDRWLLPDGVEELLPPVAAHLERSRRVLLDLYASWGYELVTPPLIEHLETLLTGMGRDLELETFKLTDPVSGRLLGVRADITPQVARIDARQSGRADRTTRLCYLGSVLRATDAAGSSRTPVQVGAELYGHPGIESDVEVLTLMLATLDALEVADVHLDLGHVGVFRALVQQAGLSSDAEARILEVLQRKAPGELDDALLGITDDAARRRVRALVHLNGGREVLALARSELQGADPRVLQAIEELEQLVDLLGSWGVRRPVHFDLAELRGYAYHTGVVFSALVPGVGQEVARGGRYDGIGESFGVPRPATGFSADLRRLVATGATQAQHRGGGIVAPWQPEPALREAIARLRRAGERVVYDLPGDPGAADCDRQLVARDGHWSVMPLEGAEGEQEL